jgi:4-carboxymuconolactone decarboxylase
VRIVYSVALVSLCAGLAYGLVARVPSQQSPSKEDVSKEAKSTMLPKDVYPDSFGRLPLLKRDQLDENGKKVWDDLITQGGTQFTNEYAIRTFCAESKTPASQLQPCIPGTWNMRLYSPYIAKQTYELRHYLGRESDLGPLLAEVAVLVAAREVNGVGNVYLWTDHERNARQMGIKPEVIDIIKYRKPIAGIGEKEACVIQYGRELIGPHPLTPETFAHALQLFGKKGVAELTEELGQYVVMGMVNKAFDMHNRPNQEELRSEVAKVFGHE